MTTSLLRPASRRFLHRTPAFPATAPFPQHQRLLQVQRAFTQMSKRARENSPDNMDWQKRPPFAPDDPDKPREARFKGSCHCKDVTFSLLSDDVLDSRYCHCDDCHKLHGAPAHWSCTMKKTDLLFTGDLSRLDFYRTSDKSNKYEPPHKISCKRCHAPICDEGRNMMMVYPSLIDWEEHAHKEKFLPTQHIFYSMRSVDVDDGMKKWAKMQDDSELLDEGAEHGSKGRAGGKGAQKKDSTGPTK